MYSRSSLDFRSFIQKTREITPSWRRALVSRHTVYTSDFERFALLLSRQIQTRTTIPTVSKQSKMLQLPTPVTVSGDSVLPPNQRRDWEPHRKRISVVTFASAKDYERATDPFHLTQNPTTVIPVSTGSLHRISNSGKRSETIRGP